MFFNNVFTSFLNCFAIGFRLCINTSYNLSKHLTFNMLANASYRKQKAPGTLAQDTDPVTGEVKRDFDINPYSYALNTSRTLDPNEYYTRNYAPFNIKHELEKPIVPTLPAALERSGVEFALMSDENMAIVYLPMYVGCCVPFGMSWETGIKALTINAARILQIDGRTGSIEPGKDADLAFFNGDPLANTTRCLGTMIDGVFYDRAF